MLDRANTCTAKLPDERETSHPLLTSTPFRRYKRNSVDRFIPRKMEANLYQVLKHMETSPKRIAHKQVVEAEMSSDLNRKLRKKASLKKFQKMLGEVVLPSPIKRGKRQRKLRSFLNYDDDYSRRVQICAGDQEFIDFGALSRSRSRNQRGVRRIESSPYKVLDAPGMADDCYTQSLDWSHNNKLIVALGSKVYSWCPETHKSGLLVNSKQRVTSICSNFDSKLAVGHLNGDLKLVTQGPNKIVETLSGHSDRCCSLDFHLSMLASGSKDRQININDVRINSGGRKGSGPVMSLEGHRGEVCSLKWSPNGMYLASGGADNRVFVWDVRMGQKLFSSKAHKASVLALSWSHQNASEFASGGGFRDQTIKIWNINSATSQEPEYSVACGGQVTNLIYSKTSNELISSHGFCTDDINNIIVWSRPGCADQESPLLTKIANLDGHSSRVLHMSLSPDGRSVVSTAGDETLRFWDVFPKMKENGVALGEATEDSSVGYLGVEDGLGSRVSKGGIGSEFGGWGSRFSFIR